MATFPRCLCVILTLWMVSSRPSASILPGASASGAWWGTPESKKIAKQADCARRAGDLTAAEVYYKQGYEDAVRRGDERAIVGYLSGIAACRLTQLRYRAALETLLEAKRHAKSIGDQAALGAIAVNLSSLHLQVWDFDSALREAQEGRDAGSSLKKPYFLPGLLIQLGRLHDIQHDGQAVLFYTQGIEAARTSGDKQVEALGLDLLGEERLGQGDLNAAEKAIEEGMRVHQKFSPAEMDLSWWRMGELKRLRGDLAEAARFTDLALKAKGRAPVYRLKHQRGQIRLATGDRVGALADFREALELSSRWRLEVMPASTSLTAANELLDGYVFSSFVDAAAQEALRTGSRRWAEEAFEALELNRAASLRESLSLADAWHRKVPPEYWETLGKLRRLDMKAGVSGSEPDESRGLRLELAEMEAKAGLGFPAKNSESFHDQSSLIHFQDGLRSSEVLLSFHLGTRESYLWVVTRNTLRVHKIAAESEIRAGVLALKDAVRAGRPEAVELGERLYKELFGQLGQEATSKSSWLLSLEGTLFEAPFAALVTERKGGKVNYLVSKHSVQTIPGALLLSRHPEAGAGWFLGVGDPIYNAADPRWGEHKKPVDFLNLFQPMTAGTAVQYARLVGTADELKTSAANWNGGPTVLLEGVAARRDLFLGELAKGPSAVHIATHVVSPRGKQAFIVFGLGQNGESEILTTVDIASLRVPGAFVAMTGCDTGSGEVHAGAGLLGLTRAWQMAGADAVLATSWNVRDSSGDVLASFYKHLRSVPAAEALRLSQMEMLNSGTWRAMPSYWASYQITGGAR
jgi:CHAT domain-containing protein/tetratricopeptide (TPR) repeat protein